MRPVLVPAARAQWRGPTTLQLRLSPSRDVVVEVLDEGEKQALALLDGVRTREQVESSAPGASGLLTALEEAGLLLDADALQVPVPEREERHRLAPDLAALSLSHGSDAAGALARRRAARVVVHGASRVGAPLAALLAEAGVGTVDVRDGAVAAWEDLAPGGLQAQDVGRARAAALAPRLRSLGSREAPDLVVLTEEVPELLGRVLMRDGVPHLRSQAHGLLGTVGPLVVPGRTTCLRCVSLVTRAIDPDADLVVRQQRAVLGSEPSHLVLAAAVAAHTALQALELLEGGAPAAIGGTLELELPGWRWRRRTWPAHPGCDCGAAEAERAAA